jgi:hypothetical protein
MKSEHEELHADLERLTMAGGRTGEAAKGVAAFMEKHFPNENAYAAPAQPSLTGWLWRRLGQAIFALAVR